MSLPAQGEPTDLWTDVVPPLTDVPGRAESPPPEVSGLRPSDKLPALPVTGEEDGR